jgi:hypothetical protein
MHARNAEASLSYLMAILLKDFSHAKNLSIGAPRMVIAFLIEPLWASPSRLVSILRF